MTSIKQLFRAIYTFISRDKNELSTSTKLKQHVDGVYSALKGRIKQRISASNVKITMTEEYFHKFGANYIRLFTEENKQRKEFCVVVIDTRAITYQSVYTMFNYPVTMSRSAAGVNTFMNVYFERDISKLEKSFK